MKTNYKLSFRTVIVDDDDIVLFLHDLMIKESGLSIDPLCFESGQTAFDFLMQNHQSGEQYLVFLDINMPVMNGWGFLEAVQKTAFRQQVAVVIVTSSIDQVDREKARNYPAIIDYIEKPLSVEICSRITEVFLDQSRISPAQLNSQRLSDS